MSSFRLRRWLAVTALASLSPLAAQDADRQTHTDDASRPQVSFTSKDESHQLTQYQLGCLSLLSYVVISDGQAVVIDPQRDVEHYLAEIAAQNAKLRYVVLTHPHADFVAGHTELAQRTGAEVLMSKLAGATFAHHAMLDGESVQFGKVKLTMWDTPGHTPNASTFLLAVGDDPAVRYAFTGDTLFIGGIGRPDLLDVPPAQLAAQSYESIQRLVTLPDACLVLPAHGAGSLCGAHLSPATTSTIAAEKATNPYLLLHSRSAFIAKVLSHQPVAPQYFAFNVALNLAGPPLVPTTTAPPERVDPATIAGDSEAWIVDLRNQHHYSEAHIRGAVNVALRGRLDTWTGIVVPFDAPVLLVGSEPEVREGAFRLRRIGFDHIAGSLGDDIEGWKAAGLDVRSSALVSPQGLYAEMQKGTEPIVIDVRTADEHEDVRIGEIGNIPVTDSARFGKVLDKSQPVIMLCNSAYRSSMAVGLAERQGFTQVGSLDGGIDAWLDADLPVIGRQVAAANIRLPQIITAQQLAATPAEWVLLDLRAAWEWNDWHVPASTNTPLGDLVAHAEALPTTAKIVLLSRDGADAFAAAGALLGHAPLRAVHVLQGGVAGYYRAIVLRTDAAGATTPGAMPGSASPVQSTTNRPIKKKRGVGC